MMRCESLARTPQTKQQPVQWGPPTVCQEGMSGIKCNLVIHHFDAMEEIQPELKMVLDAPVERDFHVAYIYKGMVTKLNQVWFLIVVGAVSHSINSIVLGLKQHLSINCECVPLAPKSVKRLRIV